VVPRPVAHSRRAIVTEWLTSESSLARVIEHGTQAERDYWGCLYGRFIFDAAARTGMLHADPHPGNFRLVPADERQERRLGVLDYGAVARLPERGLPLLLGRLLTQALRDDYREMVELLRVEGFIRENIRVRPEDLRAYLGPFVDPARTERFRFSREFMRAQLQRLQDPTHPETSLAFRLNLPPEYLLIHRTLVGTIGVLCQLEAEVPFLAILTELVPGFEPPT
jgi:predicted unusual protein kinase regulating ubiquinone biosynthesis (AarF/ABC1/UbiB family)